MADWQSTTGFMPRPIKYVCPYWHFSISGAWNSREHRLHLGDKLRKCQLGHTYSSHISKAPLFGPSVDHLCLIPNHIEQGRLSSHSPGCNED